MILLVNCESKKANYGSVLVILGKFGRIANSKSELASELCYIVHDKFRNPFISNSNADTPFCSETKC